MTNIEETIGDRLDGVRKSNGLTQAEFAKSIEVGRTSYNYYVKGEREVPISVLIALFEKYSIDPVWMIYGDTSEQSLKRDSDTFARIQEIGIAVEERAQELGVELTRDERWSILATVYTYSSLDRAEWKTGSNKANFYIDEAMGRLANG